MTDSDSSFLFDEPMAAIADRQVDKMHKQQPSASAEQTPPPSVVVVANAEEEQLQHNQTIVTTLLVMGALVTLVLWTSSAFGFQGEMIMDDPSMMDPGMMPGMMLPEPDPIEPEPLVFNPDDINPKYRDQYMLVKELISKDEYDAYYKTEDRKFRVALKSSALSPQDRQLIEKGARLRTYRLSLEENRKNLRTIVDEIIRDLELHGTGDAGRKLALEEFSKRAKDLLDNQFHVRIAAAILLRSLNESRADAIKRIPAKPYVGCLETFIAIMGNPEQHEAVKIQAVKGMERICTDSNPTVDIRLKIATAIVDELKNNQYHTWYQMVLAKSLAACNISVDIQQKPFVAQVLVEAMNDLRRHPIVRCEAARSLGRIPYDNPSIDVGLISYEIAELTFQMGSIFNRSPDRSYWSGCFWNLYLGFHPENTVEKAASLGLLELTSKAAFRPAQAVTKDAYDNSLKVINNVFSQPNIQARRPLQPANLNALAEWLKANKPAKDVLLPGMPSVNPTTSDTTEQTAMATP